MGLLCFKFCVLYAGYLQVICSIDHINICMFKNRVFFFKQVENPLKHVLRIKIRQFYQRTTTRGV